jgi:hypothetical protein
MVAMVDDPGSDDEMRAKMADAQGFLEALEGGNAHVGTPFEGALRLRFWNCDGRSQCTNQ